MSFKTSLKHQTPKWVNVLFLSLLMFFVVVITLTPPSFAQSTTSRNRVRQALVVRRQRPLVPVAGDDSASTNSSSSSTTLSTTTSNVETDQEEVIADENEDRHLAKPQTNDTFFSPFLNGFNQFNTRFNPFGRPSGQQQQPQPQQPFQQQFPASSQPFTQFAPQTGGLPGGSPSGNFQNVRLGNSPVVSQNQQFGLTSQQQQFPSFAPPQQPLQQQPPQQRPLQSVSGLTDFRSQPLQQQPFSGPISTNFQTFGFPSTTAAPVEPEVAPQVLSLPDLPLEAESTRNRVPISSRPETVTFPRTQSVEENIPETDLTASRAPTRFRGRQPNEEEQNSESTPSGTRTLRVRPNRPSTEATRFGDEPGAFSAADFNVGTESSLGTTPPPLLTRVRGRPIVPDDFPGPSQAVRGSIPPSEAPAEEEEDDSANEEPNSTGPRGSIFNGRLRPGVRIVPTGNRARGPVNGQREKEEAAKQQPEIASPAPAPVDDKPEEPRFSNSGRPLNQISPTAADEEEDSEDTGLTGNPRRRLRPVNRIPPGSSPSPSPSPPRRRLRPFSQDPSKPGEEQDGEEDQFEDTVPTVPSRLPTSATTPIPNPIDVSLPDIRTTSVGVDPSLLIAQVQAARAEEDHNGSSKLKEATTAFDDQDDDNEENNLIPFSDVPHGEPEIPGQEPETIPDREITVINLQKDKTKQNFKGFVDTDLIDDNLRVDEAPESEAPVAASPAPFVPTPLLTSEAPSTPAPSTPAPVSFVPTSLPSLVPNTETLAILPNTETLNTEPVPETVQPTEEETSQPSALPAETESSPASPVTLESSTVTPSSTSPSTSSSSVSINDELDRLQSSLDPWARLNEDDEDGEKKGAPTTTPEPTTTTTKISLFKIRTYVSAKTTTTTTFKPKSLADLFKHRNGEKVTHGEEDHTLTQDGEEEQATEQATEHGGEVPEEDRSSNLNNKNNNGNRFTPKFGKHNNNNSSKEENEEATEGAETKTENPSVFRQKLFSASERPQSIASHFVPKVKHIDESASSTTTTTTSSTTLTTLTTTSTSVEETTRKKTFGKDLLSSIPIEDDISALLPAGFDVKPETSSIGLVQDDISKFLPEGFKLEDTTSSTTESSTSLLADILLSIEKKEKTGSTGERGSSGSSTGSRLGGFRPHGGTANRPFKSKQTDHNEHSGTTESSKSQSVNPLSGVMSTLTFDDIGAFLPDGFKSSTTEKPDFSDQLGGLFKDVYTDDVSKLLPPGFKPETTETTTEPIANPSQEPPSPEPSSTTTEASADKFGVKFPTRPGGVQNVGLPQSPKQAPATPSPVVPKIKSFSDAVKSTTEFAGWPSAEPPIASKIDLKSLLASTSTASTTDASETTTPETTTSTTTTTVSTTTTTRRPTTPGTCGTECRLAATVKISDGYEWSNSLLDPNTFEFQDLADKIKRELTEVYRNSMIGDSFDRLEIEAFSKGSVLVDYYVYFKEVEGAVSTADLKTVLNQQLESSDGTAKLGRFTIDPSYTDFIVVPRELSAPATDQADESGLPDWAIAVIVIGLGSFAFVLIFGITVLTNKKRRSQMKKKHDLPLTEDMLNELNKTSLSGGYSGSVPPLGGSPNAYDNYAQDPDEFYDMEDVWNNDRYYGQQKYKRQPNPSSSSGYSKSNPYQSQLYDSWKTEWNAPYTEQYRSGPSGVPSRGSSAEMVPSSGHRQKGSSSYMTKGGRRMAYDDDF